MFESNEVVDSLMLLPLRRVVALPHVVLLVRLVLRARARLLFFFGRCCWCSCISSIPLLGVIAEDFLYWRSLLSVIDDVVDDDDDDDDDEKCCRVVVVWCGCTFRLCCCCCCVVSVVVVVADVVACRG